MRAYRVYALKNGTVIDHLPEGRGLTIIDLLKLQQWNKIVTLGIGFNSKKLGKKDIVKIEDKELTPEEVSKIAIIAPTATLNIIRNFKRVKKDKLKLPDQLKGIIKCPNPDCVTNHDPVAISSFYKLPGKKLVIRCNYCERYFTENFIKVV